MLQESLLSLYQTSEQLSDRAAPLFPKPLLNQTPRACSRAVPQLRTVTYCIPTTPILTSRVFDRHSRSQISPCIDVFCRAAAHPPGRALAGVLNALPVPCIRCPLAEAGESSKGRGFVSNTLAQTSRENKRDQGEICKMCHYFSHYWPSNDNNRRIQRWTESHMYGRSRFGPRHNSLALAGSQRHPSPHHYPSGFS